MSKEPLVDQRIEQLIDANLDRGREGLRVIEEWCRFGLKNKELLVKLRDWRHQLGLNHQDSYKKARSPLSDPGIGLTHPSQEKRLAPLQVVAANCSRVQEAMRVLEEFTRTSNPLLSKVASDIRYGIYEVELKIFSCSDKEKRYKKLAKCKLCLITSPSQNLLETIEKGLNSGVRMVQYRTKEADDLTKLSEARRLIKLCRKHDALFIVNDRVDIALAVGADGVHLGQNDIPIQFARQLLGNEKLIGLSTHSLKELQLAEEAGCDYLGVGPVNKSQTKPGLNSQGIDVIREASSRAHLPWFAIGGINTTNIQELVTVGAKRIAVCAAIMTADDPSRATLELLEALQ